MTITGLVYERNLVLNDQESKFTGRKPWSRIDWPTIGDEVIELYRSGLSTKEISSRYDISEAAMYRFLRDRGVMRTHKEAKKLERMQDHEPEEEPEHVFSKREYWLVWKLIDSLRKREIAFEGPDRKFARDFDGIRDKCLDQAFDYKP